MAITDLNGTVTDTFKYDTYGKLTERTGTTFVIFGYTGDKIVEVNKLMPFRWVYLVKEE